ncbi:MAG: hypothetical protein DLM58_09275 [Pseudonocardiales bacterium]|nr:MAG: hypothetical protein DLM58_09275 [Pseudonocardiales bacterium]
MANPDTSVAVTRAANGQKIETYKQWNAQDWFDTVRWSMNGTQLDSDFRAGLWRWDALDMKAGSADLRAAGDAWRQQHANVVAAKAKVRSAQANLVGQSGKDIDAQNAAFEKIHASLSQHGDAIEPAMAVFPNSADILDRGNARITELWNKWEGDRGNPPVCHQDVVQMQPVIAGMAQAILDCANAVQQVGHIELGMPEITVAPVSHRVAADPSTAGATNQSTGNLHAAGNVVPSSNLPGVVTSGATTHPGHTAAAFTPGTTPGTVVSPTVSGTTASTSSGPQLAGMGATAFAPPTLSSAMPIAPIASVGSAGLAGGGFVPFMPGGFAGGTRTGAGSGSTGISRGSAASPFAPFVGGAGAGRGGRTPRPGERDKGDPQRRTGAVPLVGGSPLGVGGAGRAPAQIRPGDAARAQTGGIAASLLGRAARDDEGVVAAGSTKRRRQSRSQEQDRMVFLDEEAWLTDDPGVGVVTADGPDGPSGPVAAPTVGRPAHG